jgi:hypothetical protein
MRMLQIPGLELVSIPPALPGSSWAKIATFSESMSKRCFERKQD